MWWEDQVKYGYNYPEYYKSYELRSTSYKVSDESKSSSANKCITIDESCKTDIAVKAESGALFNITYCPDCEYPKKIMLDNYVEPKVKKEVNNKRIKLKIYNEKES